MKQHLTFVVLTAAMTTFAPMSSNAQVTVETPGVGTRVGEPPRQDEKVIIKERERAPVMEEREVRGGSDCKSVTVQRDTPVGSESKTKTKCD
jgi:hypothetical protein